MRDAFACFEGPAQKAKAMASSAATKAQKTCQGIHHFFSGKPTESLASQRKGYGTTDTLDPEIQSWIAQLNALCDKIRTACRQTSDATSAKKTRPASELCELLEFTTNAVVTNEAFSFCIKAFTQPDQIAPLKSLRDEKKSHLSKFICDPAQWPKTAQPKPSFFETLQTEKSPLLNQTAILKTGLDWVEHSIQLAEKIHAQQQEPNQPGR